MSERLIVVDEQKIAYDGIFESRELFKVIKSWAKEKGYWFYEESRTESTKPEGKYVELSLPLQKKLTDYAKSRIHMKLQFGPMNDVVVKRDQKRKKVQEGKLNIFMKGVLETDYEDRWETKPIFYFLRVLFEKYLYSPYISGHEGQIKKDYAELKSQIKAFLNLEKFAAQE